MVALQIICSGNPTQTRRKHLEVLQEQELHRIYQDTIIAYRKHTATYKWARRSLLRSDQGTLISQRQKDYHVALLGYSPGCDREGHKDGCLTAWVAYSEALTPLIELERTYHAQIMAIEKTRAGLDKRRSELHTERQ
jgi:hypothetical protein